VQNITWGSTTQYFAWWLIVSFGNLVSFSLRMDRKVRPWTLRIAAVNVSFRRYGEVSVVGELHTSIPRQGFAQRPW
jgi:hypothetical protein